MRSPILDGFFPCGECAEFVPFCKHYGRRPGRPYKEAPPGNVQEGIRVRAIKAVDRTCQGCARKSGRLRVRPVTYQIFTFAEGLTWNNLLVLCPRCLALVRGYDIATVAKEVWAPPMLSALVDDRVQAGLPL